MGQLLTWKRKIEKYLNTPDIRLLLNLAATSGLPRYAESGDWYRLTPAYLLINVLESTRAASRFNAGRFQTLYLASDITTALFEANPGRYHPVRIRVELQNIADLTDPDVLEESLGISLRQLIEPWSRTIVRPTQEIGAALYRAGYEGFKVPSPVRFGKTDLVVLPQNIQKGSTVVVERFEPQILETRGVFGAQLKPSARAGKAIRRRQPTSTW